MKGGFALPLALYSLVVVSGLVAAILFVAIVGRRAGAATIEVAQVQYAAEAAAHRVADEMSASLAMTLPVSAAEIPAAGGQLTRFGPAVWGITAVVTGDRYQAVRRVGTILVTRPARLAIIQGLSTPGRVSLENSDVDASGLGAGEGCQASIEEMIPDATDLSSADSERLDVWMSRAKLVLSPGAVVSPGPRVLGGVCDEGRITNWGDPVDPVGACATYFPAIAVDGSLTVEGGMGQGVLAVRGDLIARAGFRFHGLVIVGGRMVLDRAHMFGAVQVDDSAGEGSELRNSTITYSGCSLRQALSDFGVISAAAERWWFQPY